MLRLLIYLSFMVSALPFSANWGLDVMTIGGIRLTPKLGVTAGSVIRLYYGYHAYTGRFVPQGTVIIECLLKSISQHFMI